MANEIAKPYDDPWANYARHVNTRTIIGMLLRFNKGDFLAGQDEKEIPLGTILVANMDQIMVGWVRWEDNRPTDQDMGLIAESYMPKKRRDYGELSSDEWPRDKQGKPRDPWQFTNYMVCFDEKTGQIYTLAANSTGAINAIGELCKAYSIGRRQHLDQYPLIKLGSDKYKHRNPEFGYIKFPTFTITGWVGKARFNEELAKVMTGDEGAGDDSQAQTEQTTTKVDTKF